MQLPETDGVHYLSGIVTGASSTPAARFAAAEWLAARSPSEAHARMWRRVAAECHDQHETRRIQ